MTNPNLPSAQHSFNWQGRDDVEDGELGTRVHHRAHRCQVDELQAVHIERHHAVAVVGLECDAGVARNKGRIGAQHAPNLIRQALANLAWHKKSTFYDLGNIRCEGDELEQAQTSCADIIAKALNHMPVIVLGGGHEVAWTSFQGLARHFKHNQTKQPTIGIINFDAHFDLRVFESDTAEIKPSSGTPFNQIHSFCQQQGWDFNYACLGVSRASNTPALFKRAQELGVLYMEDSQFSTLSPIDHLRELQHFINRCDYLYLTIDLDVFPAATAPGVSAPAARGVSYDALAPYLDKILYHKNKLLIADIAEYNPQFDVDNQTARLAARLCWDIANAMTND